MCTTKFVAEFYDYNDLTKLPKSIECPYCGCKVDLDFWKADFK